MADKREWEYFAEVGIIAIIAVVVVKAVMRAVGQSTLVDTYL